MPDTSTVQHETLFRHPVGLFTLFFAEMWERFSYYGMRALLVFYMIKGFLGYSDNAAYGVYGAYTALVYATGFIGGMFADRLLGAQGASYLYHEDADVSRPWRLDRVRSPARDRG